MKSFIQDTNKEEILRCSRIYKGFKEGNKFIKSVFEVVADYIEENKGVFIPVKLDLEKANEQLKAKKSINLNPDFNTEMVIKLIINICGAIKKANPALKNTLDAVKKMLEEELQHLPEKTNRSELDRIKEALIKETALEQDLGTFLFSLALSAIFRQHLVKQTGGLRTDLWERGDCLLCGEKPHYGILREDGSKVLECWLCGTQWVHTRIKCPYCANTEAEEMGYFTAEENEVCRVHFCNRCCRYYKVIDVRKTEIEDDLLLPVHNLATLAYDELAKREGFKPGSGLEWVNEKEPLDSKD